MTWLPSEAFGSKISPTQNVVETMLVCQGYGSTGAAFGGGGIGIAVAVGVGVDDGVADSVEELVADG
jgi:hypothetical protein